MVAGLLGRKADAFASLLDGTDPGAAQDPALAHLANLTQRLSAVPGPSAPFRAALRDQLMTTATHQAAVAAPTAAGATHTLFQGHAAGSGASAGSGTTSAASTLTTLGKSAPLWIKIFTGTMALAVSATGVGVGAHRALPGDLFYGVKRQVEAVQLDLASGSRDKATTQLGFAHARTDELAALLKRDHVTANAPISSETAAHIRGLLQDWAEEAGVAVTSLISQIQSLGSASSNAALSAQLRQILKTFSSQQFVQLGGLLRDLPTGALQTLTVSALGYLQRVDQVVGGDPTALIKQLPVPLSSIPGLSGIEPQLQLPTGSSGTGSSGSGSGSGKGTAGNVPVPVPSGKVNVPKGTLPTTTPQLPLPSSIPSIPLPTTGPGGVKLPTPGTGGVLPSVGVGGVLPKVGGTGGSSSSGGTGGLGKTVTGTGQTVTGTVNNTVGAVTGGLSSSSGPSLSLPSALPTLPPLPALPQLP